jgi:hypothetical protein
MTQTSILPLGRRVSKTHATSSATTATSKGMPSMRRYLIVAFVILLQFVGQNMIIGLAPSLIATAHAATSTPTRTLTPTQTPTLAFSGTRQVPWGALADPTKRSRWAITGSSAHATDGPAEYAVDFNWGNADDEIGTHGPFDITAVEAGIVSRVSCSDATSGRGRTGAQYGCYVELVHGAGTWNRYHSFYAHMKDESIRKVGQALCIGDFLGFIGKTYNQTAAHLHFHMTRAINGREVAYQWTNMRSQKKLELHGSSFWGSCTGWGQYEYRSSRHYKSCSFFPCQSPGPNE